ncbi:alpha/beta fold hydrolase [Paenibacillus sp. J2TS4]|uniref:alpha/beta fold hydrolase n=1 Tax=Paenibacillus sp. J2TS4 TaxID=2807194 RepID=UPI001B071010|nr:alpha/beta hydrolase [Paenibacillus sp. J2TS4]GIP31842.1 alpha/beta hydrolase [Paenibacillus sp. J2TS4]
MLKLWSGGYIRPIKDHNGNVKPDSLSVLEKLILGGAEQWITIRAHSRDHPVLLFLHGGPGASQVGTQHKFLSPLEESFVVVNWDQRGAGKSYSSAIPPESMNVEQLTTDLHELMVYLRQRFDGKKVFMAGHSWGAYLGMVFAHKHPEFLHAYIGINQPVHRREEEQRSYQFTLDKARQTGNHKALQQLQSIEFIEKGVYKSMKHLAKQRAWLTKFGGVTYQQNALRINIHSLLSSHLTWRERFRFMKSFEFSVNHLWAEFTRCHLPSQIPRLSIPVYFIVGRHDRIVHDLCEEYYQKLEAPYKELILFEHSGHLACFEEPANFIEWMKKIASQILLHDEKRT